MEPQKLALQQSPKKRIKTGYIMTAGITIAAVLLLKTFLVEPVKIEGIALEPGLRAGDRVFLIKPVSEISRGDIVLFGDPRRPSIQILERVAALPGEKVQLRDGLLYINGRLIAEPYVSEDHNLKRSSAEEIEVPPGKYFMLGDNRDDAFDSRKLGPISRDLIEARYWLRYWPVGSRGL